MPSPRRSPAPRPLATLIVALALLAACDRAPTAPIQSPSTATAHFAIADGAHGGLASFYFLPPVVPAPSYSGTFDGTKAPTVRVCALANGACGATVATFSGADVKVDPIDQSYMALWKTKDAGLDPTKTYRVEVQLGPQVLGFVDVIVVENGSQLKHVDGTEFAGLVDGTALPIRFRLEAGTTPPEPPPGPWAGDQYLTYTQAEWGDPQGSGGTFLMARYDAVYSAPSALLTVGSPYPTGPALIFTSASAVLDFLPQTGTIAPMITRLVDPTTSTAGVLGGETVALQINVQFSDAGQTPAPDGVRFGDLVLCGFGASSPWNGVIVRDLLATLSQTALVNARVKYMDVAEVVQMAAEVNAAFANGIPSAFAQDHLVAGSCPGAWRTGQFVAYSQFSWGTLNTAASTVLYDHFVDLYQNGVTIGVRPGPIVLFNTWDAVMEYLPAGNYPGVLDNDLQDPTSTPSGMLGGTTLALRFDVDLSDAGYPTSTGARFGDLRVCGVASPAAIQGEAVRDLLARADQTLSGLIPIEGEVQGLEDLVALLDDVASTFDAEGVPSFWARMHLVNGACP